MDRTGSSQIINIKFTVISTLLLLILLFLIWLVYRNSSHDLRDTLKTTIEKQELLSSMRINMLTSVNLEKSAVIADTDELSVQFAKETKHMNDIVDNELSDLKHIMKRDSTDTELEALKEFDKCWGQFRKIDKVLLDFAVENTNIKASSLSLTKSRELLERFEQNMIDIINMDTSRQSGGNVAKLACEAIVSAFKIQYLHGKHISTSEEKTMNEIEGEVARYNNTVNDALLKLNTLVGDDGKQFINEATYAYSEFIKINTEIVNLSRQNTNIRSFELSLGRKRKITAECDEILRSLQNAVRSRTFDATR